MMIGWYYAFVGGDLQAGFLNSVLAGPAFAGNAPPALPVGRSCGDRISDLVVVSNPESSSISLPLAADDPISSL